MAGWLVSSILTISRTVAKIGQSLPSSSTSADPCSAIEEDLKKLEGTLEWIQAVLDDAEEREIRDRSVKLWLRELRGLAYEAEDVLDEYHYQVQRSEAEARAAAAKASRKRKRVEEEEEEDLLEQVGDLSITPFSSSSKVSIPIPIPIPIPDGMGDKIRDIRTRFDDIAKARDALQLRPGDGERRFERPTYPPPSGSLVDDSGVFGREDDKKKLMALLFSDEGCQFSVIPIVGMGGLGKTTLAQLVYNDPDICKHFNLQGWVSVSVGFDVPRIMREIIESISKKTCDLTGLSSLQDTLRKQVEGKSVLLVMDDVWNYQLSLWEPLKFALLGGKWVRVIVTTRDSKVAEIMQGVPVYTLHGLAEDQCRLLFRRHAFGAENPQGQLVEIADKIVKKCAGLPLAVKALGSMLGGETDIERWEEVLESDLWELGQVEGEDGILPALRLSYHRLPAYLKPCFVYCSMYPKSHIFKKDELIMLWMAQGYIQPRGRRSLEDTGSECFDQLLGRSFFQIGPRVMAWGDIKECFVMHDLMFDLAKSISREEWCTTSSREVGHLRLEYTCNLPSHYKPTTSLRTLLIPEYKGADETRISTLINSLNLKYLRALRWVKTEWLANSNSIGIGSMKHLRCLGLDCSSADVFPEWLHQLYNLQILELQTQSIAETQIGIGTLLNLRRLDLKMCDGMEVLPSDIGDLINLRYLCLPGNYCRADESIVKLTNLRTLSEFKVTRRTRIGVLKGMVELSKLHFICVNLDFENEEGIENEEGVENEEVDEEQLAAALENLQPYTNLKELEICSCGHGGIRFPSWMGYPSFSKLTNVTLFSIWGCNIVSLPSLGRLPALSCLRLGNLGGVVTIGQEFRCCVQDHNATTEAAACKVVGFPSLKKLKFKNLDDWEEWDGVQDGDFPQLEFLKIKDCSNLRRLPTVSLIQSRTLHISFCNKLSSIDLQQNSGLPSRLKELHIVDCQSLTSVMGLHTVDSLQVLKIKLRLLKGGFPVIPFPREDVPSKVSVFDFDGYRLTPDSPIDFNSDSGS